LHPIKDVIVNGHDKLNRLRISETPPLFSAKNYYNWLMNVEDIASQITVIFGIQHDRYQISGVHVSSGSAETLARAGGIINHHLLAYSLGNIPAKNYPNRLIFV